MELKRAGLTVVETDAGENREEGGAGETFSILTGSQVCRGMMCYCTEESLWITQMYHLSQNPCRKEFECHHPKEIIIF